MLIVDAHEDIGGIFDFGGLYRECGTHPRARPVLPPHLQWQYAASG
jgi:hypothetical protein